MAEAFLDSNVLVYSVDVHEPAKRERALVLLDAEVGNVAVSAQVLQEFYVVVTRKLSMPIREDEAEAHVRELAELPLAQTSADLVVSAIDLSRSARLSLWDALIVRAAQSLGCSRLYSEDLNPGQAFGGVLVINPFASDAVSG